MAREEAAQATVARCSGSARPFICLAKWLERPRGGGAAASEPPPLPPPRSPQPPCHLGRPHLSGQQEFPFLRLPQLHHVRHGLDRCTNTKRHTAGLMHGKETLPVSRSSPPCTRLTKTSLPSLPEAEATRGASRGAEHNAPGGSRQPLGL